MLEADQKDVTRMSDHLHLITPSGFGGNVDYDYPDPTHLTVGARNELTGRSVRQS
jgi:hypothetical protein